MAAPEYVPVAQGDRPREGLDIPGHDGWKATRPGDLTGRQPEGRYFGNQGPDQGYALTLVDLFHGRLVLTEGEEEHDAVAGCMGVAMARASLFGRAPVVYDLELAFGLFGYLDQAPADLVEFRKPLFAGAGHHYWDQREIAGLVPESTLRLTPAAVRQRLGDWRSLLAA